MANPLKFSLKLFPDGTASSCFGILSPYSQLLNNFVKVTCDFNMKLPIFYEQAWMELKLTGLEKFSSSGLYLVPFSFFSTWNRFTWKFNNTALILTTSNVTSYWSRYFLISDSVIVKSKIPYIWIIFPCSKSALMTKIILQWVLAKRFRQDKRNFMLKEKLNCFNYWIYCNFKSFICLLGYEHFTFCIFRKIPWTLFNECQPIFKILQENISKPWKSWIINSWKW